MDQNRWGQKDAARRPTMVRNRTKHRKTKKKIKRIGKTIPLLLGQNRDPTHKKFRSRPLEVSKNAGG